ELSITELRRRDGVVFNGFIRDLTDKIAAEERIRHAEKMEAVGQLTGGIAHDFNNILTVITGTIEILGEAVADKPQLAAITRMIDDAASRGAELTQHLLAFARKQPLQPREVDVNTLIIDTAKLDKVFDPFFTSKGPGKGTGLGLSMVYGFVKQSAGHIKIYSEEGHGTTIKMYLPPGSGAIAAAEPVAPAVQGGHETILVVED